MGSLRTVSFLRGLVYYYGRLRPLLGLRPHRARRRAVRHLGLVIAGAIVLATYASYGGGGTLGIPGRARGAAAFGAISSVYVLAPVARRSGSDGVAVLLALGRFAATATSAGSWGRSCRRPHDSDQAEFAVAGSPRARSGSRSATGTRGRARRRPLLAVRWSCTGAFSRRCRCTRLSSRPRPAGFLALRNTMLKARALSPHRASCRSVSSSRF